VTDTSYTDGHNRRGAFWRKTETPIPLKLGYQVHPVNTSVCQGKTDCFRSKLSNSKIKVKNNEVNIIKFNEAKLKENFELLDRILHIVSTHQYI